MQSEIPKPEPTKVDLPKVAQMLDAGWQVQLWKNNMGSYTAKARHADPERWHKAKALCLKKLKRVGWSDDDAELVNDSDFGDPLHDELAIDTDDFTPEQALTRLAYKVHGEII